MESIGDNVNKLVWRADEIEKMDMFKLPLKFARSQRGSPILCCNGYRYRRERELSNGNTYWRCLKSKCKGRIIIKLGKIVKYHTHDKPIHDR